MPQILYTRSNDGCDEVRVRETEGGRIYTLERPTGAETFDSARKLLIMVTGHPEARHWTLDRYFRTGRHTPRGRSASSPILEALGPGGWAIDPSSLSTPSGIVSVRRLGDPQNLGIDLAVRGREVAKLLYKGFSGKMRAARYEPEDVLQEVYKGILIRNKGKCPFDARVASFGHYVHMVCRCVLSNYHRRSQRYRSVMQAGLPGWTEDGLTTVDAGDDRALVGVVTDPSDVSEESLMLDLMDSLRPHPQRELAIQAMPLLKRGKGMAWEYAGAVLDESPATMSKAYAYLRREIHHYRDAH